MGIWGWAGTIAAGWLVLSFAVALAMRGAFRKTPAQQHAEDAAQVEYLTEYRNRKAGA